MDYVGNSLRPILDDSLTASRYFNGDSTVKAQVKKAYDIVAAW